MPVAVGITYLNQVKHGHVAHALFVVWIKLKKLTVVGGGRIFLAQVKEIIFFTEIRVEKPFLKVCKTKCFSVNSSFNPALWKR